MKPDNREEIFEGSYMTIFKDGDTLEAGCDDGVGFIGTIDEEELKRMYEALHKHYTQKAEHVHSDSQ